MRIIYPILLFLQCLMFSCGAYLNQPIQVSEARIASKTNLEKTLVDLPKPNNPIVIAVYKFKDQTGQYKPSEVGSSFSTAVTQGGTNILIKALDDSGWFKVIERENMGNLLNERKIIRQTRMQYQSNDDTKLLVSPLLFAGVILEGGIVSYDANIMTGGIGLRYFGSGGSTAYRQDRVTVYLRAIATKTGEVLKNITTSKTILSQSLDGGVFRYVKFSRLLEAETGFTFNEPADIAVTEAVQKAVYSLVIEGVKDGLWNIDSLYQVEGLKMMEEYDKEISAGDLENYLGVKHVKTPPKLSASTSLTGLIYQGDFPSPQITSGAELGFHYESKYRFGLSASLGWGKIKTYRHIDERFSSINGDFRLKVLKNTVRSPYINIGIGNVFSRNFNQSNPKFNLGGGLDYSITRNFSINAFAEWNQFFRDDFDELVGGKYKDYFYKAGIGLKYHFLYQKKNK